MSRAPTHGVPHQLASTAWITTQQRSKPWSSTRLTRSYVTPTPQRKALPPPTWRAVLTATQPAATGR